MPKTFTFNEIPNVNKYQPESITYHSEDNIIEKGLTPIQVGGLLPGILFVGFQNIDPSLFKGGADFIVTYEDVLSKPYSMSIRSSASIKA
jgi:hypothetical protein